MKTRKNFIYPQIDKLIFCYILLMAASTTPAFAVEFNGVSAVPDYGKNDCISFKQNNNTNPLNFTYGYACVSEMTCEVFSHGCVDESCDTPDYSRGTRTSLTTVPFTTPVRQVNMAAMGRKLKDDSQWCLVKDGAGNYWALDKWSGSSPEQFNLINQHKTIIPCRNTDSFSSNVGCQANTTN